MIEIRRSEYETQKEFAQAVGKYDKKAELAMLNLHRFHYDFVTDIVARFVIGKIELILEYELPTLTMKGEK